MTLLKYQIKRFRELQSKFPIFLTVYLAVDIIETAVTIATLATVGAVATGGAAASSMSVSAMSPGSAPSGVPQPGTGNKHSYVLFPNGVTIHGICRLFYHVTQKLHKIYSNSRFEKFSILVGGGTLLSPGGAAAGSPQALALALVPAGLTPVAFFPPNPSQKMKAVSVIFSEPILKRRINRGLRHAKYLFHATSKRKRKHRNNRHRKL